MAKNNPTYNVFISHSQKDAHLAAEISDILRAFDLRAITDSEVKAGDRVEEVLWEAIAESQAIIAVIPETESNSAIAFELGAAKAWNKPVYAVTSDASLIRLPSFLQ